MDDKNFYTQVGQVFIKHDPLDIHFDDNADEYGPEIQELAPKLKNCRSEAEIAALVGQVFINWFGEAFLKKMKAKHESIANDLTRIWSSYVQQN